MMDVKDFDFNFTLETFEDDNYVTKVSQTFKGVARNSPMPPQDIVSTGNGEILYNFSNSINRPDPHKLPYDLRVHFMFDGNKYQYDIWSPKHIFCPSIIRGVNPDATTGTKFELEYNIFEDNVGDISFLISHEDFEYLKHIGCIKDFSECDEK